MFAKTTCFAAASCAGFALFGLTTPTLDAAHGFGLKSFDRCTVTVTNGQMVVSDILADPVVFLRTPVFFAAETTGFEVEYRAEGLRRSGGQLYYIPDGIPAAADVRKWVLPPLVSDGQWHVQRVTTNAVRNLADWLSAGAVSSFRYDPVDTAGGRIEIRALRFLGKDAAVTARAAAVDPAERKRLDADPWPKITPECWTEDELHIAGAKERDTVAVTCLGGACLPQRAKAGDTVALAYDYRGPIPATWPIKFRVSLVCGETIRAANDVWVGRESVHRLSDTRWRIKFDYALPQCVSSCRGRLRAHAPVLRCVAGELPEAPVDVARLKCLPGFERKVKMGVGRVGGQSVFTFDGQPKFVAWGGVQSRGRPDHRRHQGEAPNNVVTVYNAVSEWWPETGVFDFTGFDRMAQTFLEESPGAYFMWDLSIYPPADWCATHPDEMCRDQEGNITHDGRPSFSLASTAAMNAIEEAMVRAINYLEQSPYANRIIGYRLNSGHTIEWLGWDPPQGKGIDTTLDFSPAAQKAFAAWAPKHYPALRDFTIPRLAERRDLGPSGEMVWDPHEHLRTVAYHDFLSTVVADDIIRLARRARALVGPDKLLGTYYGYVMTLWHSGNEQIRSHFSLKHLLDANVLDYIMSPQPYPIRELGDAVGDMKPFATLSAAGVVPVIEDDTRTHNSRYLTFSGNCQTLTAEATTGIVRRNMGFALCRGQPLYFYALCAGTEFDYPQFARDIAAMRAYGDRAYAGGMARRAEIAYCVSEETMKAMPMLHRHGGPIDAFVQHYRRDGSVASWREGTGAFSGNLFQRNYKNLARVGAPVDYCLLEDLADRPGAYKLYIFPNAYKTDRRFAGAIARIRARGAAILWMGAAGYMAEKDNDVRAMTDLTGFGFAKLPAPQEPRVTMADGCALGIHNVKVAPLFAVTDGEETLGSYASGGVAAAKKTVGGAPAYYLGVSELTVPFVRELARRSGVHLFSDTTDPMEANDRFVALHARFAGRKTIRLPRRADVYDVFEDRLVARGVTEFSFTARLHESRLFLYE